MSLPRFILLGLLFVLAGCSSTSTNTSQTPPQKYNLPELTLRWSNPNLPTSGYNSLQGDLFLTGGNLRAVNIRTHELAYRSELKTDYGRTHIASVGNQLVVAYWDTQPGLALIDKELKTINKLPFPAGTAGVSLGEQGPVVVGNSVYVAAGPTVYKYAVADLGKAGAQPLWYKTFGGPAVSSLLVQDENRIYIGESYIDDNVKDHFETVDFLIALNGNGNVQWKTNTKITGVAGGMVASMGIYKDTVVADLEGNYMGLQAFRQSDGQPIWAKPTITDACKAGTSSFSLRMTIAADHVYLGNSGGVCVLALHADTGQLAWTFNAPYDQTFDNKPLFHHGVIYATNGRMWALDAFTGKPLAVGAVDTDMNSGAPLAYDPVEDQILQWGPTGVHAFKPLK